MALDGFQRFEIGKWGIGVIVAVVMFVFGRYSQYIQENAKVGNEIKIMSESQNELKLDVKDIKQIMTNLLIESQTSKSEQNYIKDELDKVNSRIDKIETKLGR